jgi:hypothetical protein
MGTLKRTIRYYGLIELPPEAKKARRFVISFDIIRPPVSIYLNDKYNPAKTFLGYAIFLSDTRVVKYKPIEWDNQIIDEFRNDTLFLHQSLSCALNAILTSFVNLELALQLVPFEKINPIEKYKNLFPEYDKVAIKLLTETSVGQINLDWDDQEKCSVPDSKDPEYQAPPDPLPPPKQPGDSPDSSLPPISPPYDGGNDGGLTYKPDTPPPDPGERCQNLTLTFSYEVDPDGTGIFQTITNQVIHIWGEFEGLSVIRKPDNRPDVAVSCHGIPDFDQPCSEEVQVIGISGFSGLSEEAVMRNPTVISLQ